MQNNMINFVPIAFITTGMAIIAFIDNAVVIIAQEVGLWQFHFLRSAIAVPLTITLGVLLGWRVLPKRFWWVFARSLFLSAAMVVYFGCLGFFPIASVAAGLFTAPILVMFIDSFWSGYAIGMRQLLAALVGFAGTLMILQPDVQGLAWPNLIPIIGGLFYAIGNVATRKWCEGESALALFWVYMTQMLVIGAVVLLLVHFITGPQGGFLTRGWVWPSANVWGWIFMQAVFSLVGLGFVMQAYLIGNVTYVSIFEYSMLIFVSIFAWLMFGTLMGGLGIAGIALIIISGSVIAFGPVKKRSVSF